MEVPGLNPLQNRGPIQGPSSPVTPQPGVPDLILNAPGGRTAPAAPQAPAQAPYQAPAQAIVQHSTQNIMNALMEMGVNPSNQNMSIAQNLANYGHPVSNQTLQIVQQALSGLPDRSATTIEAAVILLTQELPVNSQTVMALKQLMNGQPLPQQLQNLPQNLAPVLQQMQNLPPIPAPIPALTNAPQNLALPPGQTTANAEGLPTQTATTGQANATVQANAPAQTSTAAQQGVQTATGLAQASVPNASSPAGSPAALAQTGLPQSGQTPTLTNSQVAASQAPSSQAITQIAVQSSAVQQVAGQAQAIENRGDGVSKTTQQSTAQKIQAIENGENRQQALEAVSSVEGGKSSSQSLNINQHLPQAYAKQEQSALEQLYLHLTGGDPSTLEKLNAGAAKQVMSTDEGLFQMLRLLGDILQLSSHLSENMQLKDYQQLFIQHQQLQQLTGLLEQKVHSFQRLFHSLFPELAKEIQQHLHTDGLDIFSKLAQLIENNQAELKAQLKHLGGDAEKQQLLNTLRDLLEQVGFQIDKVQANLVAREMLSQNQPIQCIPLMVHANQESYPAELYIRQDYDPKDPQQGPDGNLPLHITLTLETKNMGRISVDMSSLKSDLSLNLKVLTRRVKIAVDERLDELQKRIEKQGNYSLSHLNCVVEPDLETRQSMLLPPKRSVRSLRRVEGVV
ncbi:hypothetical protein COW36_15840 [bacterium (Candidatus Blackallbacteria) CG17_big_fil_post_rev_8_21_14_2_50_48_46]|uniref:Uncharacterized protein n=1 Tax=bacterium (Candidatus Blackallbacteria) CG17_big_fil_post_rev_8_21_14_2_50_48_46 TaxID=2014261 RepID=A0A2M7G222_9BACT|nr:MAG: hypothetical protein COW64_24270 [bacterium (Candidatus Blackallbacteria) CG18_big_fil_WC_8_21_14_2_50_49_26]PIW15814.1 MAG: hypothetical protein COW36_15840 [bacterium (Candidatus Blackallbacteria) CG17_big_fil_post_rev_8_21_14_2_50_48_46]PIW47799.1 MAG: hypothetical protein COW20_11535 [bacterium (Candidatus Blackallbacteria) CG13_big_fil_rev_8_21_14_2_50_49_14]